MCGGVATLAGLVPARVTLFLLLLKLGAAVMVASTY